MLPPYTPKYNPIELYLVPESQDLKIKKSIEIKINDEHRISHLKEAIVFKARDEIIRCFVKVLNIVKLHFS